MAWIRRRPAPGALCHSDRGSHYAGHEFQRKLTAYGMRRAMSRKGNCWNTQSKTCLERRSDLTRAGIGCAALVLSCRSSSPAPRALPGPAYVT
jgi:putative transposase